jgi:hypothetical protein
MRTNTALTSRRSGTGSGHARDKEATVYVEDTAGKDNPVAYRLATIRRIRADPTTICSCFRRIMPLLSFYAGWSGAGAFRREKLLTLREIVEDHYAHGGLGDVVLWALAEERIRRSYRERGQVRLRLVLTETI